ncbi:MAG: sigma-70 family RNA polymerase sigma factor, partial [Verrucomicrobiota bacterium]
EFMRNYQNMVFSTAIRLLGNEHDAADVSQEVFVRAHDRFADLHRNERAGGWLKVVTRNLCLNHLSRYRSRWRFFSEMFHGEEQEHDFAETLAAPDDFSAEVADEDRRHGLEEALRKLPASQRVPLVLYHFEEMSYDDIARQLGVSLSKVKVDIHRGREALRKKLTAARAREESGVTRPAPALGAPRPIKQS